MPSAIKLHNKPINATLNLEELYYNLNCLQEELSKVKLELAQIKNKPTEIRIDYI